MVIHLSSSHPINLSRENSKFGVIRVPLDKISGLSAEIFKADLLTETCLMT